MNTEQRRQAVELGQRIKALREARDESMEVAARRLKPAPGVSSKTWESWEHGRTEMKVKNFRSVAAYFGVSGDYLLGWTEDHQPASKQADEHAKLEGKRATRGERSAQRGANRRSSQR